MKRENQIAVNFVTAALILSLIMAIPFTLTASQTEPTGEVVDKEEINNNIYEVTMEIPDGKEDVTLVALATEDTVSPGFYGPSVVESTIDSFEINVDAEGGNKITTTVDTSQFPDRTENVDFYIKGD
jgi:hypothetical protein